jgi:hypothetical protein
LQPYHPTLTLDWLQWAKLEQGRLDKQQFVSCEEVTQEQDDKLVANATSSGWPTMQQ